MPDWESISLEDVNHDDFVIEEIMDILESGRQLVDSEGNEINFDYGVRK